MSSKTARVASTTMTLSLKKFKHRRMRMFTTQAVDVLHRKMHVYDKEAKEILTYLISEMKAQNKNSPALKSLYQMMSKADEVAIECAAKLAPYQTAKLESIEVKSKIQHSFVIRAPQRIANLEDWQKITGATALPPDTKVEEKQLAPIQPSIHDFDLEDDEIETFRTIN